jgi:hypothetical protein
VRDEIARKGLAKSHIVFLDALLKLRRAEELAGAVEGDMAVLANPTRKARIEEADAQDDLDAANAAAAVLDRRLQSADDALRRARNTVVALANSIIRGEARRVLAEAVDSARRLQRARLLLHLMVRPEAVGTVIAMGRQKDVFGEVGDPAAERLRDKGFAETKASIDRELEFGLQRVFESEKQWSLDPSLQPWIESRRALIAGDADALLPE